MKTKFINFALLVAIVIVAAIAAVRWLPSMQKSEPASSGYVLSLDQSTLRKAHFFERARGIDYNAVVTDSGIGKRQYTVEAGEPFSYSHEKLYSVITKLCSLKYTRLVEQYEETPPDAEMERYGFAQPAAAVTLHCDEGDYELVFGNTSGLNDGRYLLYENGIYVVSAGIYQLCMKPSEYFRTLEVFPDTGKTLETLARFTLYDKDGSVLYDIAQQPSADATVNAPVFAMNAPVQQALDGNVFYTSVVSPVYSFVMTEYVEDFPKDLAQYGLDAPYQIRIETLDGTSATLLFHPAEEEGTFYGMREDVPAVFSFYGEADFLKLGYYDLLERQILSVGADKTASVTIVSDALNAEIECRQEAAYNGRPLSRAQLDTVFRVLNQMRYTGDVLTSEAGRPDWTITVTDAEGGVSVYEFFAAGAREYAVRCDGVFTYRTNASYLNQMQDALSAMP